MLADIPTFAPHTGYQDKSMTWYSGKFGAAEHDLKNNVLSCDKTPIAILF
jgi:hypothetical protein